MTANDLDQLRDLLLFADVKIYSSEGTTEEARLGALHTFSIGKEWFADNGLNLNERKTQVMIYVGHLIRS